MDMLRDSDAWVVVEAAGRYPIALAVVSEQRQRAAALAEDGLPTIVHRVENSV